MLINCPECFLQVSDKAQSCPHCGFPLKSCSETPRRIRRPRHKRLPNGFGQISEIKRKGLRKPFRAMVTVGKREDGKPICKLLKPVSYFETYNEAYSALMVYNRNPYDEEREVTFEELYKRWSSVHFETLSKGSIEHFEQAFKHLEPLYHMRIREIRVRHMKDLVLSKTDSVANMLKTMLNQMFDYAVEYELADHNYARDFALGRNGASTREGAHMTFSDEELSTLWNHVGESIWIDMILVQCYTGFRPSELCTLRKENVDLMKRCLTGGSKTKAGKNREVPIHSKIIGLVEKHYWNNEQYLFGKITYSMYDKHFNKVCRELGLTPGHKPHDCRVCFVTLAKKYNLDEYAIKKIIGHTVSDLTERVYTKRGFDWLLEEVEKIA